MKPDGMSTTQMIGYLNDAMKIEGLADEDVIVTCQQWGSGSCHRLECVTEDMADKILYLNGMQLPGTDTYLRLLRKSGHQKQPRHASWSEQHLPHKNNWRLDSYKIDVQVFLHEDSIPASTADHCKEILNKRMQEVQLCEGDAVVSCYKVPTTSTGLKCWVLETATADLAERLVYLNRMPMNQSKIILRRHKDYKGPLPKFLTYQAFMEHYRAEKTSSKPTSSEEHQTIGDEMNENDYTSNKAKDESENSGQFLVKQDDTRALDADIQKQEGWILQEVVTSKLENERLKKELLIFSREHASLKEQYGRVNEELKAKN
jgi:hypothetical protein